MKISTLLSQGRPTLSFEVFPPKGDGEFSSVRNAAVQIAALRPDYMSVTYGAAGSGASFYTGSIAAAVQEQGLSALAHLTCVNSTRQEVRLQLAALRALGIENILALRGDLPAGMDPDAPRDYRFAADLVADLRSLGDFSVGGACYPEGHVECASQTEDLRHLKDKVAMGCDFLITQMFFDNSILYSFLYRMQAAGIHVPVIAGVMPVTNAKQICRIVKLSNASLPHRFRMIIDKFGDDPAAMKQAGVAYATEQIVDLIANGVNGVHVYVMNKPDVAAQITANLSEILRR
ncbi:5,10-methylenetetrahydrofolate reductase [bioreactor metagenome]|uniref:5,10-methylenetetrahydrofolate reductase n=1 Tax=bioreactor metagenome TaxID=1076179 RepID=A0A644XG17_9ZZZZ